MLGVYIKLYQLAREEITKKGGDQADGLSRKWRWIIDINGMRNTLEMVWIAILKACCRKLNQHEPNAAYFYA